MSITRTSSHRAKCQAIDNQRATKSPKIEDPRALSTLRTHFFAARKGKIRKNHDSYSKSQKHPSNSAKTTGSPRNSKSTKSSPLRPSIIRPYQSKLMRNFSELTLFNIQVKKRNAINHKFVGDYAHARTQTRKIRKVTPRLKQITTISNNF